MLLIEEIQHSKYMKHLANQAVRYSLQGTKEDCVLMEHQWILILI